MLHEIELVGHLGADPVLSYTANTGTPAATVRIAATRRYTTANGDPREETAWFSVELYRETAVNVCRYLHKGSRVFVKGTLKPDPETGGPRIWIGRDGKPRASYELSARVFRFMDRAPQTEETEVAEEIQAQEPTVHTSIVEEPALSPEDTPW